LGHFGSTERGGNNTAAEGAAKSRVETTTQADTGRKEREKIQVHPTGLVDPKEPNAKVKFLAAEALRGVGGLLLNGEGKRFCDELGHRDYVTGEIWKTKVRFAWSPHGGKKKYSKKL
jgi:aspartate oxidase